MRDVEQAIWFCHKCSQVRTLLWALEAPPCGAEDCPLPVREEDLHRPEPE